MAGRGRRAALPSGPGTERGLLLHDGRTVLRCFEEETGRSKDYDLTWLPLAPDLLAGLAAALERRVAPGQGPTRIASFDNAHTALVRFADYVSSLAWPPRQIEHLAPEHLDGFLASRLPLASAAAEFAEVKRLLIKAEGLTEAMLDKLGEQNPKRPPAKKRPNYSAAEFGRIAQAARADLRAAARRIRDNRELLERYRTGRLDTAGDHRAEQRMLLLLQCADESADVPRMAARKRGCRQGVAAPVAWVADHGGSDEVVCWLHLSPRELAAAAVLMAVMTGQNKSVVSATPAAHHRADGYTGQTGSAITSGRKHRRQRRSHMDLVWSEVPDWISIPQQPTAISAKDELHTPFGLYMLLHELTSRSRALMGTGLLLVCFSTWGGGGMGRALRAGLRDNHVLAFGTRHQLMADEPDGEGHPVPLTVTMDQLRTTYLELNQKPVAHTERTLATSYLLRNHGNLAEYQKVVAAALAEEVGKARVRGVMLALTAADMAEAARDPRTVAAKYGIDAMTLRKMIAGELDTVMNACADNEAGDFSPPGQPCRASFMACLECSCARALPRHLPVQVLVHDRLLAGRAETTPLVWIQRFAAPHARLADILRQHGPAAVDDARALATDADRNLVERFLNRELDFR